MNEIRRLLEELETAEKKTNEVDAAWDWEKDPDNEELERKWMAAYKVEFDTHQALVDEIVSVTDGRIDRNIAKRLVGANREDLKTILSL